MTFQTAFDVNEQGYATWWFPASGLLFVAFGALLVFGPTLMRSGVQGTKRRILSWFFFAFALLWTVVGFAETYREYRVASSDLSSGHYSVVEGPVTDFVPKPYATHSKESFTVGGRRFSYSDAIVTSGFNSTVYRDGPIREGLYVRVTYSGNLILRLEISQ